jgi:GT2 family glycosyltransferase
VAKIRQHFLEEGSDYLAGRVELRLDAPLPEWFPETLLWVIGKSPFGDEVRVLENQCPQSANCAIRADVFDAVGGYDPRIAYYGEEVNFFYRVKAKGFVTLYRPDIVVDHCVPASRLSKAALIKKADLMGRGAAHVATLPSVDLLKWIKLFAKHSYRLGYVGCAWLIGPRFDRKFTFRLYLGYLIQLISSPNFEPAQRDTVSRL